MSSVIEKQNTDIIRFAGDTHPTKTTLTINAVPVDLTGWSVVCRCRIPVETGDIERDLIVLIDCVISDAQKGKISIYPHARYMKADLDYTITLAEDEVNYEMLAESVVLTEAGATESAASHAYPELNITVSNGIISEAHTIVVEDILVGDELLKNATADASTTVLPDDAVEGQSILTLNLNSDRDMDYGITDIINSENQLLLEKISEVFIADPLNERDHTTDAMENTVGSELQSNQCWTRVELLGGEGIEYDYSIIREKKFDLGDSVPYTETMTCLTGKVILKDRV